MVLLYAPLNKPNQKLRNSKCEEEMTRGERERGEGGPGLVAAEVPEVTQPQHRGPGQCSQLSGAEPVLHTHHFIQSPQQPRKRAISIPTVKTRSLGRELMRTNCAAERSYPCVPASPQPAIRHAAS